MLATNAFIVVADGSSAHFYRNTGHDAITLELVETVTPHSFSHVEGLAGHAPVEQSPQDRGEAGFITQLVHKLNALALSHALPPEVVIIADPTSLGHMRPLYHAELKRRILREIHKTMVKSTTHDIAVALSKP
jgi:protein required for attachment to host cells